MKKLYASLVLAGLVTVPSLAMAADSPHSFTGNVGVTTDYIFRGITQTQHEPAIQGGVDYSHASGFYAGAWASNVAWVKETGLKDNSSMEIDLYGGYKGSLPADFGYDLGLITYYYPGDKNAGFTTPNTTEVYAGLSWKFLTLKYSHVVSDYFIGWGGPSGSGVSANKKTKGSNYLDLSASYDLGGGWGVLAHVGHQKVENYSDADYTDWKVGVTKDVGFGVVTLAYTDTNADEKDALGNYMYRWPYAATGEDVAKGQFALSFLKTF